MLNSHVRVMNGVMLKNTLVVRGIERHPSADVRAFRDLVAFEGLDELMERTGALNDAMPGDVYELRKVGEDDAATI